MIKRVEEIVTDIVDLTKDEDDKKSSICKRRTAAKNLRLHIPKPVLHKEATEVSKKSQDASTSLAPIASGYSPSNLLNSPSVPYVAM